MLRNSIQAPAEYKVSELAARITSLKKTISLLQQEFFPKTKDLDAEEKYALNLLIATEEALQFIEQSVVPQVDKGKLPSQWWIGRQLLTTNKLAAAMEYYVSDSIENEYGVKVRMIIKHEASYRLAHAMMTELQKLPETLDQLLSFVDHNGIINMANKNSRLIKTAMTLFGFSESHLADITEIKSYHFSAIVNGKRHEIPANQHYQTVIQTIVTEIKKSLTKYLTDFAHTPHARTEMELIRAIDPVSEETLETENQIPDDTQKIINFENNIKTENEEIPMLRQTSTKSVIQKDVHAFLIKLEASSTVVKKILASSDIAEVKLKRIDGQIKYQNESYEWMAKELPKGKAIGYTQAAIALLQHQSSLMKAKAKILTADMLRGYSQKNQQAIVWLTAKKKAIDEFLEIQNEAISVNHKRKEAIAAQGGDVARIQKVIEAATARVVQKADELNALKTLSKVLEVKLTENSAEDLALWSKLNIEMAEAESELERMFGGESASPEYQVIQTYFTTAREYIAAMLKINMQKEQIEVEFVSVAKDEANRVADLAIGKFKPLEEGRIAALSEALSQIRILLDEFSPLTSLTEERKNEVTNVYLEKIALLDKAFQQENQRMEESAECKKHLVMQRINNFIEDKKIFYKGKFARDKYEADLSAISQALMVFAARYDGTFESNKHLADLAALTDKYPGWNLAELERKIRSVAKIDVNATPAVKTEIVVPESYKQAQMQLDAAIMEMAHYAIDIYQDGNKKSQPMGAATLDLALELAGMKNEFFRDAAKVNSVDEFKKFEAKFTKVLHSRDDIMNEHRARWKVIVANIAIALTGIGAFILLGRAVASCVTGKPIMFFAHTNRRRQLDRIEKSMGMMAGEQDKFSISLTASTGKA